MNAMKIPPHVPTVRFSFVMTPSLRKALDAARGANPLGSTIENLLWSTNAVKNGARTAKVKNPQRLTDGRGAHMKEGK